MSGSRLTPPDRNTARGGQRADGYGTPPSHNSYGDDPLDDRMASRGKTSGFTGRNGAGVSAGDINRGYIDAGDPPDTPARDSWERMSGGIYPGYDGGGRQTKVDMPDDAYAGGFLSRDPFTKHDRE